MGDLEEVVEVGGGCDGVVGLVDGVEEIERDDCSVGTFVGLVVARGTGGWNGITGAGCEAVPDGDDPSCY